MCKYLEHNKMSNTKQSRKDFLKRLGLGLGAATVAGTVAAADAQASPIDVLNSNELTKEQKEFMVDYEEWLSRWHSFVRKRKIDREDAEVQKELFAIAGEADKYRDDMDDYMQDPVFAKYFDKITKQIVEDIGVI